MKRFLVLFFLVAAGLNAQTSKTGRIMTGLAATRPSNCTSSDVWTDTDTPNSYKCYPDNIWNLLGNGPLTYTVVSFNATPTFSSLTNSAWSMLLTGNVTSSTFTTTGAAGTIFQFDFQEDGVGGRAFVFPGNVNLPTGFIFDTAANHHNQLAFIWNGTTWNPWQVIGSGGGSGTPASPLNSLQKNQSGAFGSTPETSTGTNFTVGENAQFCGTNPYYDINCYGGYSSSSPPTTTGTINSGNTALTLAAAQDFANGQGIVVYKAGAATTLPTPAAPATPVPFGGFAGSTTTSYKYVFEDYAGGLTASSTAGTVSTAQATLGLTTFSITAVSRTSGLTTYTCSSTCTFTQLAGLPPTIQITGFTGGSSSTVNGTFTVNTQPDSTHFTVTQAGMVDYTESASGTVSVNNCNLLQSTSNISTLGIAEGKILRTWIYRQDGGVGNYNLKGVAPGQDPFFIDCGQGVSGQPSYVPTTAPSVAQAGYLATTIVSGGGTTSIVTAATAGTNATNQTVLHDNSAALRTAFTAAQASGAGSGVIVIPFTNNSGNYPFESLLDFTAIANPNNRAPKILMYGAILDQPWVLKNYQEIEGLPVTAGTSFEYRPLNGIGGTATPMFLVNHATNGSVYLSKIKFATANNGQTSFVSDQNTGAGGEVGLVFEDVAFSGTAAPGLVIKGGFDFWFNRGVCNVGGTEGGLWYAHPCMEFTGGSPFLNANSQNPGRVKAVNFNVSGGTGFQLDSLPMFGQASNLTTGGGNFAFNGVLHESNAGPVFKVLLPGSVFGYGITFDDVVQADQALGSGTPMLEMTGTANFSVVTIKDSKGLGSNPVISGPTTSSPKATCINNVFLSGCGPTPNTGINGANITATGGTILANTNGELGYQMDTPAAPTSCIVSAGGSVSVGTHIYAIAASDPNYSLVNGQFTGITILGATCSPTTSGGNQTVTITRPTLPIGATGWFVWRDGAMGVMPGCVALPASQTTFVDTSASTCGVSAPQNTTATRAGIGPNGGNAQKFLGGGFATIPTSTKTTTYVPTATDNIIPVDATAGSVNITPNPAITGSHWTVLRLDSSGNTVSIVPTSGTINGAGSVSVSGNSSVIFTCVGGTNCQTEGGSGGSGGSGTINNASQYALPYYSGVGSNNIISGVASPTVNGTYLNCYIVVASVAVAPSNCVLGSNYNAQTGTTYTLGTNAADRAGVVDQSTQSTATVTLPAISGALASNYVSRIRNSNSGILTITATSPNTIDGGSAGGSTTLLPGWNAILNQDSSPNWFTTRFPTLSAFPTCLDSAGNHLNFSTTLGFLCGTSTSATQFYQVVGNGGSSQTQRQRLNFVAGANITITPADNSGTNSTDVTIAASSGSIPCTTTALSLQFNNAGAFGCLAEWTYSSATLTTSATGKLDMSAQTGTASFKIPAFAGATVTAAGFTYDTTNKNVHTFSNGADAINVAIPSAPTTGDLADWSVASSVVQAHDSGILTANVVTASSAATAAGQLAFSTSNNKALSFAPLAPATLTDGATVTYALSNNPAANAVLTFTVHGGSRTMNITNPVTGGTYLVRLVQDATGGENLTGGTGCTWKQLGGGGSTFTLTATANAVDILTFYYDGTSCWSNLGKAYN